jgi:hypothetical protein
MKQSEIVNDKTYINIRSGRRRHVDRVRRSSWGEMLVDYEIPNSLVTETILLSSFARWAGKEDATRCPTTRTVQTSMLEEP